MRGFLDALYRPGDTGTYEAIVEPKVWEQLQAALSAAYSAGDVVPVVNSTISYMVKFTTGDGAGVCAVGFTSGLVLRLVRRQP